MSSSNPNPEMFSRPLVLCWLHLSTLPLSFLPFTPLFFELFYNKPSLKYPKEIPFLFPPPLPQTMPADGPHCLDKADD